MAVITISRGTFSGGQMLAECLCRRLGYRNIDREVIVQKAATPHVTQQQLREALEETPGFTGRNRHKRYLYLALIQAALAEDVRAGDAVYHGLAGHLLLRGVPGILRLRIIAPMDFRLKMAQDQLGFSREAALRYVEEMDQHRRKWTRYLYSVDWNDPSLYDFVINLEQINVQGVCDAVASIVSLGSLPFLSERSSALNDLAVASRVRADLAIDPSTANLEVHVEAREGSVAIEGDVSRQADDVLRVARAVSGVREIAFREPERIDEAWPWTALSK